MNILEALKEASVGKNIREGNRDRIYGMYNGTLLVAKVFFQDDVVGKMHVFQKKILNWRPVEELSINQILSNEWKIFDFNSDEYLNYLPEEYGGNQK